MNENDKRDEALARSIARYWSKSKSPADDLARVLGLTLRVLGLFPSEQRKALDEFIECLGDVEV